MARILFLLFMVLAFAPDGASAGETGQVPMSELIERARQAKAADDEKAYDTIADQIFERVTGFPAATTEPPTGVSDEDFVERLCAFGRIIERTLPPQRLNAVLDELPLAAFAIVRGGRENDIETRTLTDCVYADGWVRPSTRVLRDGIAWAKELGQKSNNEIRQIAAEYKARAEKDPEDRILKSRFTLADYLVTLNDAVESAERSERDVKVRKAEGKASQEALVDKADKGDLVAQMTVAHGLESGDRFRKDFAKAYFWYTRALHNGGGKAARDGMERLFPHLDIGNWASIHIWTVHGYRPY